MNNKESTFLKILVGYFNIGGSVFNRKLQFKSPIRYNSKFLASIVSIILSKVEKRSGDDCGGM